MDRRGRELFEVGQSRTTRLEAHDAILQASSHDLDLAAEAAAPRARHASLGRRILRPRLLLAALGLGLVLGAAEEATRHATFAPEMHAAARFLGFGIDQVALAGHRFTPDRDIFDALDLSNVRTFGALDTQAVKSRIERLPWIDAAELTRVYPSRLEIRVSERKPFAVWTRADSHYLIDKTGRTLAAVSGASLPDLPRFAGEGAAAEAATLLENVARYPLVSGRLEEAQRISERRWRLKLANATTIELPADGEVGALEELTRDAALSKVVEAGATTLDFRGPGRVAIRPEAAPVQPAAAPNTGS